MDSIGGNVVCSLKSAAKGIMLCLILCATGAAWATGATIPAANSVSGVDESYNYYFTGANNGTWSDIGNWAKADGTAYDNAIAPALRGSGTWNPILFDGDNCSGNKTIDGTGEPYIDGWALRIGAYNGVNVTISDLKYWKGGGTTCFANVDSTSKLTVGSIGDNSTVLDSPVELRVASAEGIVFTKQILNNSSSTANAKIYYTLIGDGSVKYNSSVNGYVPHCIRKIQFSLAHPADKTRIKKTLVSFTSTSVSWKIAAGAVVVIDGRSTTLTADETNIDSTTATLSPDTDHVGDFQLRRENNGIYLYYIDGPAKTETLTLSGGGPVAWSTASWSRGDLPTDDSVNYIVNVTEDATLNIDANISATTVQFNISEGKKLTLAFASGCSLNVTDTLTVSDGTTVTLSSGTITSGSATLISATAISGTGVFELSELSEEGYTYSLRNTGSALNLVRMPSAANFTFNGTYDAAAPSGWGISSWSYDNSGSNLRVGPSSNYKYVWEVSSSWSPGSAVTLPESGSFSFSIYADVSKVPDTGNYVITSIGNGVNNKFITMYCRSGHVRLGNLSGWDWVNGTVGVPIKPGYHLWTATCNADGTLAIYCDDGEVSDSKKIADSLTLPDSMGLQIGKVWGNHSLFSSGEGAAIAAVRGYDGVLTADQVWALSQSFPATDGTEMPFAVQPNASGKTLTVYTSSETSATVFGPEAGNVVIPAGNEVNVTYFRTYPANQSGGNANTVTINGTLNVSGSDSSTEGAGRAVVLGYWLGSGNGSTTVTVNDGGSLNAPNAYFLIPWATSVKTAALNISGGTVKAKGLYCGTDAGCKGSVTLSGGGTLEVSEILTAGKALTKNFGKGTFRITADATETQAINFQGDSAENATALDPNGHILTMSAAAMTGSGYIKIASGTTGKVVFNGSNSQFTGTVVIEPNAAIVEFSDTTQYHGDISVSGFACSVTDGNKLTYYPTFESAIDGANGKDITVYNYTDQTLPDHYRVKNGKLELIPGTVFSVW